MKRCPKCAKTYDENLSFCLQDGTALILDVPNDQATEAETQIVPNYAPEPTQQSPIYVDLGENQTVASLTPTPTFQPQTADVNPTKGTSILTYLLLAALFLALGVIGGGGLVLFMGGFSADKTVAKDEPSNDIPVEKKEEVIVKETPRETPKIEKEEPIDEDDEDDIDADEILDQLFETPTPTPKRQTCYLANGSGGEVNVRSGCDYSNCTTNPNTIARTYANRTPIAKLGKSVRSGKFTWVKISIKGRSYWVASSKIRCS